MQFSKTLIISIFLLLTSKTFPAEEVCLQPLPAKQRGNGTGWLFENITDSRARVKLFGAYYFYSALEWLYRNDVKEEAVLDKTLSGRNT